jgi:hypothetical protein
MRWKGGGAVYTFSGTSWCSSGRKRLKPEAREECLSDSNLLTESIKASADILREMGPHIASTQHLLACDAYLHAAGRLVVWRLGEQIAHPARHQEVLAREEGRWILMERDGGWARGGEGQLLRIASMLLEVHEELVEAFP